MRPVNHPDAVVLIGLLLLALQVPAAAASVDVTGGGLTLACDAAGQIVALTDGLTGRQATGAGGLQFLVGTPAAPEALTAGAWQRSASGSTLTGRLQPSGLDLSLRCTAAPDRLTIAATLSNPGPQTRLVQLQLALPCAAMATPGWRAYDGYDEVAGPAKPVTRSGFGGLLPLIAACDARSGLALGIEPHELHSWLSGAFDPIATPATLTYAVRRVVDPGGSETATFVLYAFDGAWGPGMAVDRYYDLFPDCFRLNPAVDRRFALAGGYVHSGYAEPALRWEESRRLHHGWQPNWAFRRTGDWMPDADHWPATAGELPAYLKARHDEYAAAAPGNPICHYVDPTQCEADLAAQLFADSILWNKAGLTKRYLYSVPVISGESCHYVFPGVKWPLPRPLEGPAISRPAVAANSFMRSTLAEIPQIIGELGACGIYIDNASGTMRHYGPDLTGLPGRAYDDDGRVFATSAAGTAAVADLTHTLDNGFGKAGVPTNGVGTYPVAFHTDASIQEGTPWERARSVAGMRRMMGGKSLCWWEDHLSNVLRWRALTPAQILEAMDANVTYCLLYGLRWGIMPSVHQQRGRAELVRHMPLLAELVQAGWRPVAPVKTDPRLWVARYGTGLGTLITISNPTRDPITAGVTLATLPGEAKGTLVYVPHAATPQPQPLWQTIQGRESKLSLALQPKQFIVLRAAAAIASATPLDVSGAEQTTPQQMQTRLQFRGASRLPAVAAYAPSGWEIKASPAAAAQFAWSATGPYAPACTPQELAAFPFLKDGKPAATIVTAAQPTAPEARAALRLARYFEYCQGRNANLTAVVEKLANPDLALPISTVKTTGPVILIGTPATHPALAAALKQAGRAADLKQHQGLTILRPDLLLIAGRTAAEVEPAVLTVLAMLDCTHPVSWGLEGTAMWDKARVSSKEFVGARFIAPQAPAATSDPEPTGEIALPPDNLLLNPSFEEGDVAPAAWNFSSPNASEHKCEFITPGREGKRGVFVPKNQYWSQLVKLETGKRYRLSVWRRLSPNASFLLWWCGIRENGTEGGGARLYEQCLPNNDLIPDFLPAEYFSQPDVWNRTETAFTAPGYPQISIRLAGDSRTAVDAVSLVPVD